MNAYRYKAISRGGVTVDGVIEAYDEFEAVTQIKQDCTIVLKIEQVREKKERFDLNEPLWLSEKALTMVCSQFAILLRAGLPMMRTVTLVSEQTKDRLMKKILRKVAEDVSAGYSLSMSFERHGSQIPNVFIETIRAGEMSGTLERSFEKLSDYFEKSYKMKSKVRSAMMYPAFLCVLAVAVVTIVMIVTVPVLLNVFQSYGGKMPLPTQILMQVASFMASWWWLVLMAFVALVSIIILFGKTELGKIKLSVLALRIPVLGKINLMRSASQFSNTMSTLLAAGLPMTSTLRATSKVMDNYAMGLSVGAALVGIEEGKRLGEILQRNPYLPPLLVEMVSVGEESGSLESTLETIGVYYDGETEAAAAKALSMLEPAITLVMGAVIGFIVLAIYAPTFTMYSVIG